MLYNWAVENLEAVACIAGIYSVCDLRSYPGLDKACRAYGLTRGTQGATQQARRTAGAAGQGRCADLPHPRRRRCDRAAEGELRRGSTAIREAGWENGVEDRQGPGPQPRGRVLPVSRVGGFRHRSIRASQGAKKVALPGANQTGKIIHEPKQMGLAQSCPGRLLHWPRRGRFFCRGWKDGGRTSSSS